MLSKMLMELQTYDGRVCAYLQDMHRSSQYALMVFEKFDFQRFVIHAWYLEDHHRQL